MRKGNKSKLLILMAVFLVGQGFLHRTILFPRWNKDYNPKTQGLSNSGLGPDQILFALAGFRELIAGILWVKADSFFETGNYDAVLPIIRLVTWLDPHQIDVYSTGMWHIAYNFTDEEQRSDRRYIPSAIALGKEGAKQNDKTYELFFETGWIWYHKIDDDYPQAIKWFQEAHKRADMMQGRKSMLSNAYLRNNEVEKALDMYIQLYDENQKRFETVNEHGDRQLRDTAEGNIDNMIVRMVQRGWLAEKRNEFDKGEYDTRPPFDVQFSVRVAVEEPSVIRVQGTYEVAAVGSRMRIVLRDENYKDAGFATLDYDGATEVDMDPEKKQTFMQDQLFVKNRRFNKRIDMSKDATMYPFSSDSETFLVELFYDPRSAPVHIQDRFGFNGEGFTDANFISTTARPGHKVLYTSLKLTRDQILRRGEWNMRDGKVPVVQTKNFNEAKAIGVEDDKIIVPSMLAQQKEADKKK